jgi:hypothetical protein
MRTHVSCVHISFQKKSIVFLYCTPSIQEFISEKEIDIQKQSNETACLLINTFICSGGFKYAEGTRSVDAMLPFTHTIFRVSQRNKSVNQLR